MGVRLHDGRWHSGPRSPRDPQAASGRFREPDYPTPHWRAAKNPVPPAPGNDPPLSPLGQERAQKLVQVAAEAGVTAIYTTQFIRTQQTAKPLADLLSLDVNIFNITGNLQQYADDLVDHILSEHRGEVVLIVSHSHTVPLIVEALGTSPIPEIPGNKYDNLFIVTIPRWVGPTKIVKAEYGEDSP